MRSAGNSRCPRQAQKDVRPLIGSPILVVRPRIGGLGLALRTATILRRLLIHRGPIKPSVLGNNYVALVRRGVDDFQFVRTGVQSVLQFWTEWNRHCLFPTRRSD